MKTDARPAYFHAGTELIKVLKRIERDLKFGDPISKIQGF
jgi:hypothetical protein